MGTITLKSEFYFNRRPMFFGDTTQDTRKFFYHTWRNYSKHQPLSPLETQILEVILQHPEYHSILEAQDSEAEFVAAQGQMNPFLHMGLHLAIRDQVAMDRPQGIGALYQQILQQHGDRSQVEHLMMDPLMDCLWQAQRQNRLPDEQAYLQACQALVKQYRDR